MIGICADSNAQLPRELIDRFSIAVVPLTIVADDREYLEGVDIDADRFYDLYADGHRPKVDFQQPSAGQFALAYDELIARGCTQVLSIHSSVAISDTLRAARLAAHSAPVAVRLVDSRTGRIGVSCCIWAAADAIAAGASLEEAAQIAESLSPAIGNVYVLAGLDLAGYGATGHGPRRARKVFSLVDNEPRVLAEVDTVVDAVNTMGSYVLRRVAKAEGRRLNVAVGSAHQSLLPVAEALAHAVGECSQIREVVRFRIGPSLGVEVGPGCVGCVVYPS
jgi:fatty acid-binding protein DegV